MDCIRWEGRHRKEDGRPMTGSKRYAYRVAYEEKHGVKLPRTLALHHTCENPWCVNPDHLEPLTHAAHLALHGWTGDNHQADKTHCPSGHEYSVENTYVHTRKDGRVERHCKECTREAKRRYRAKRA